MHKQNDHLITQVRIDQIRMVFDAAPISIISVFSLSLLITFLYWSKIDYAVVVVWFATFCLLNISRVFIVLQFRKSSINSDNINLWSFVADISLLLTAICWGVASYYFFVIDSIPHQFFLTIIVTGVSAGAVATLSARRYLAISYSLFAVLPLLYRYIQAAHEFTWAMSVLIVIFIFSMIIISIRLNNNLKAMIIERYQYKQIQQRDSTRNQVLKLLAKGAPLSQILQAIVLGIEREHPNMLGSILLLDDTGNVC